MKRRRMLLPVTTAAVLGALVGVGVFTFGYAEGLSYFETDPRACANCHVMDDYFDTWQKSSHAHVAVCIDCHLPHDFVRKYVSKADNGFFHSMAFTLDNFHEPIRIKPRNRRILLKSCLHCHADVAHQMLSATAQRDALDCIHCHHTVGHGP